MLKSLTTNAWAVVGVKCTAAIFITGVVSACFMANVCPFGAGVAICFRNWLFSSFPHRHVVLRFQNSADENTTSTEARGVGLTSKIPDGQN